MTSGRKSATTINGEKRDEPAGCPQDAGEKGHCAQIACFIADENPAAAERFLEAVEASFAALARMPHMGVPRHFRNPKFADVRMWRVRDFDKYLIFYCPRKNGVEMGWDRSTVPIRADHPDCEDLCSWLTRDRRAAF